VGSGGKKVTVGYKRYAGMLMLWGLGPFDLVHRIFVGGKVVREYTRLRPISNSGVTLSASNVFGGESGEGGIEGRVSIGMGNPDQEVNPYLNSIGGNVHPSTGNSYTTEGYESGQVPPYRGVVSFILEKIYYGLNPYLKKWEIDVQSIYTLLGTYEPQWNSDEAAIGFYDFERDKTDEEIERLNQWIGDNGSGQWWGGQPWSHNSMRSTHDNHIPETPSQLLIDNFYEAQVGGGWGGRRIRTVFSSGIGSTYSFHGWFDLPDWINELDFPLLRFSVRYDDGLTDFTINGIPYAIVHDDDVTGWGSGVGYIPIRDLKAGRNYVSMSGIQGYRDGEEHGSDSAAGLGFYISVIRPEDVEGPGPGGEPWDVYDINPIHLDREIVTSPTWGMGYPVSDIDENNYRFNSEIIFNEGLGVSFVWDTQAEVEKYRAEVMRHIDATYYIDRKTGKFKIKLIRENHYQDEVITLGEDDIVKVSNYGRPSEEELVNSVTVIYQDYDTGEQRSYTERDLGLIQQMGFTNNVEIEYLGFTHIGTATIAAKRDLNSMSKTLLSATIECHRKASVLNPGDVFWFEHSEYHDGKIMMRASKIFHGDNDKNRVKIIAVEDVFREPVNPPVATEETIYQTNDFEAYAPKTFYPVEVPYYSLVSEFGQTEVDNFLVDDPDTGYFVVPAAEVRGSTNADLYVDSGAGFEKHGIVDYSPGCELSEEVSEMETTWQIQNSMFLEEIELGSFGQIGQELVSVDYINLSLGYIEVTRGVLDSLPEKHATGAELIVWQDYADGDQEQYSFGETINTKIVPIAESSTLTADYVTPAAVGFYSRAIRPYPPGNVQINGEYYSEGTTGTIVATWSHRDRTQQTSGVLYGFTTGDIGPEPGTTYNVRAYDVSGTILYSETGITGTTATIITPGSDANYSDVIAMLFFDGSDGSATFVDEVGPTWIAVGAAQLDETNPKFGSTSAYFDGSGDAIERAAGADFEFGDSDFTIEGFIMPGTGFDSSNRTIMSQRETGNIDHAFTINTVSTDSNKIYGQFTTDGTSSTNVGCSSASGVVADQWQHFAWVKSGNNMTMYLEGVGGAAVDVAGLSMYASPENILIGAIDSGLYSSSWLGRIDCLRVTKAARYTADFAPPTQEFEYIAPASLGMTIEIESERDGYTSFQKYRHTINASNPNDPLIQFVSLLLDGSSVNTDQSPGAHTLTPVDGVSTVTATNPFGSDTSLIELDGTGRVELPLSNDFQLGTGDFCIEGLFRFNSFASPQVIIQKYTDTDNRWHLGVETSNQLLFFSRDAGVNYSLQFNGAGLSSGAWHHIALARDSGVFYVFVDGAPIDQVTESLNLDRANAMSISGRWNSTFNYMIDGQIDEFRITKSDSRYNVSGFTPPAGPLPQS
jgi:hypothetical protein